MGRGRLTGSILAPKEVLFAWSGEARSSSTLMGSNQTVPRIFMEIMPDSIA